jgi:hypothetical protein
MPAGTTTRCPVRTLACKLDDRIQQLATQGRNIAAVTTLMPDGTPQTTPLWVDADGEHLLLNTEVHRLTRFWPRKWLLPNRDRDQNRRSHRRGERRPRRPPTRAPLLLCPVRVVSRAGSPG